VAHEWGELVIGEAPRTIAPMLVTARLEWSVVLNDPPMLDSLLAWVYAARAGLLAPVGPEQTLPIAVPLAEQDGIRLASQGIVGEASAYETRHKHRRAPWQEYARMGAAKIRRCDMSVGPDKSYRRPYVVTMPAGDVIHWYALGDLDMVRALLVDVRHVGKHRGTGKGRVREWRVEPCEPWDGFPVLRDGQPLRPLPKDWPGLAVDARVGFRVLTPPYFQREREQECVIP
jgi:hypothetical protein